MSLDIRDFDTFFAEFHGGQRPFAWQRELLDHLLSTGRWPGGVVAPTGAGKSSVLHVHAFAQAVAAGTDTLCLPRRLVHVVGRRALVDDMASSAGDLGRRLQQALADDEQSVIGDVARALQAMNRQGDPLPVTVLRGGVAPQRGWVDDPAACQVVCATPDMLGSRLLFRGYGTSRQAQPREAGLLAYDSVLVVDEAHLNRQLLATARRVATLAGESPLAEQVPVLQVVETTGTPSEAVVDDSLGLDLSQSLDDVALAARMTRPKPIRTHPGLWLPGLTKAQERVRATQQIVDLAVSELAQSPAGPVGIVVNRVESAVNLCAALQAHPDVDPQSVSLLVGPQRAWERETGLTREREPLFYVATQTIEVGVDLDLCALITDLAPGTALAQRAGRLNRRGLRLDGQLHLLAPMQASQLTDKSSRPYTLGDLAAAQEWITRLGSHPGGISPQAVQADPAPQPAAGRLTLSHLEDARAALLARTSERQVVEPDLSFWLRDQLEEAPEVSVIARRLPYAGPEGPKVMGRPIDRGEALAMMTAAPPQPHEVFPSTLIRVLSVLSSCVWTQRNGDRSVLLLRAGEWLWADLGGQDRLRAGDIVCLPGDVVAARHGVLLGEGPQREPLQEVLDPRGPEGHRLPLPAESTAHRLTSFVVRPGALGPGSSAEDYLEAAVLEAVAQMLERGEEPTLPALEDAMIDVGREEQLRARLRLESTQDDVRVAISCGALSSADPRALAWVVIDQILEPADDASLISELSSDRAHVRLSDHQHAVGVRARDIATALGLHVDLIRLLEDAGLHHDDGKVDSRFQDILWGDEAADDDGPLAKGGASPRADRRRVVSDLPSGWRHEQLSAAILRAEHPDSSDMLLRLVGTSHGHGRGIFRHGAQTLLGPSASEPVAEAARELFDVGRWDALIDRTHDQWGVWGAAYLEAVLRAADTTISREGR